MTAISPWNEPDEATALGAAVGNVALPERLGVLPSPGADTFSMAQESRPGTAEDAQKVQTGLSNVDQPHDLTKENDATTTEKPRSIESTATEIPGPEIDPESAAREHEDELYDTTPKQADFGDVGASQDVDETTPTASKHYESTEPPGRTDPAETTEAEQAVAGAEIQDEEPDQEDTRDLGLSLAETTDVVAETPEPRREDESADDSPLMERSDTALLAVPAITEQSNSQDWDERSGVSSNNNFRDAQDEPVSVDEQSSRRSSVSSLGQDELDSDQPVMSSQAVPAGPSPERSTVKPDSGMLNRPYHYEGDERSKSYVALGLDDTGAPLQESLDIAKKPEDESYEFIQFGDSKVGGAAFQRQPAVRDASGAARPKRFSGMVKGRGPTLISPDMPNIASPAAAPAASAISDYYGLEGVQDVSNLAVEEISPERAPDMREEKKAKRKSGLFDAFKRSPSITKTEFSRDSGPARLESRQAQIANVLAQRAIDSRALDSRPVGPSKSIAKTPQRASTTAKEPEQKKKRFSGLGSIFGRSSTTGHKSEKPSRKLTKGQTPSVESSQRQASAPMPNSEEYERMRQQRREQQQQRQPNTYPPPSLGPSQQYSISEGSTFKSPEDMLPPQRDWYASRDQRFEEQAIPQDQPPRYRPLHSDIRRDSPLGQVPESFRPVETSFSRPVRPSGPPLETDSYSPPTSPVSLGAQSRQVSSNAPSEYDRPAYGPPPDRHSSYRSSESGISGQSEWQRSEWRRQSSSPSISPVQTRSDNDAYPPGRGYRVGSITEEMARSPAREYNDQQTPWAITLPRPGEPGSRRPSRPGMQGPPAPPQPRDYAPSGIGYAEAYPPPARWQNQRGLPMSPESPRSSLPVQPSDSLMSHAPVFEERLQRGIMQPQGNAYPSPPVSPESQWFYNRAGLNPPPQRPFHARSDDVEMPPPPRKSSYGQQRMYSYENEPPAAQPRRTLGYTGRRDDPAISEEGVEMRGVSYPGQEWMPERWE